MATYLYHELQESSLCGQHCLNNLLQEPYFTSIDLAEIAQQLDQQELQFISENNDSNNISKFFNEGSNNVDNSGNFSIQVLKEALKSLHNIDLISWTSEEGRLGIIDPTVEKAFIINHLHHWYAIRKINDTWWNLNSAIDKPQKISPFYLSAFLAQLREEGSSVFIVKGNLPPPKSKIVAITPENCKWYRLDELESTNESKSKKSTFESKGHILGTGSSGTYANLEEDDEETMLAKAISASLADISMDPIAIKNKEKEDIRAKRLAALSRK